MQQESIIYDRGKMRYKAEADVGTDAVPSSLPALIFF